MKDGDPAPVCQIVWSWGYVHCVPARPSAFLTLWGTMLLQFIFSVNVDLGTTVKLTLQGLFGTFLAYATLLEKGPTWPTWSRFRCFSSCIFNGFQASKGLLKVFSGSITVLNG